MVIECLIRWLLWRGYMTLFMWIIFYDTELFLWGDKYLLMMIVDEFLHAIDDDFDCVCMYWKMLMLIVDDFLLNICIYWVICSCIQKSDSYIHIGDDQIFISILAMTKILYVFIFAMKMIHMYLEVTTLVMTGTICIQSCLGALHNLTGVILAYVLGE